MGRELHVHTHPSRLEHWRHLIEIVALVAAGIWAIYVFVYQERIKPASEVPEVQPPFISVDHSALAGSKEFVKVTATTKNAGAAPFALTGMVINVYGIRYGPQSAEHIEHPISGVVEISKTLVPSKPTLLYSFYDTWHGFGANKDFGGLAQGAQFDESFSFAVPARAFDSAKVTYELCWSKPGDQQWQVATQRNADGSLWFDDPLTPANVESGLHCGFQRRGAFYPL